MHTQETRALNSFKINTFVRELLVKNIHGVSRKLLHVAQNYGRNLTNLPTPLAKAKDVDNLGRVVSWKHLEEGRRFSSPAQQA